ncbi:uncharacterized protein ACA1_368190 [Acanthamoeba castellanii str. Neff]|uniref:Uncharacterized protein n=1 Tax=Acanthamoeba castellanii (strain ATCC 30010 / Neff) TaxID=1257118 RepID=L8H044_ACACF|nr:uncharacterized protein ACA1_368190 [Acanthamoeba castellanii str. Neff]ELR18118.1 hypothetical protein ACA1_368190 [Acanthamoeba castellanii str. Neff]
MNRFASFVCLLALAFLACLVASVHGDFAPAGFAAPCGNCGNCPNRQECVPSQCKSCPALVSSFYPYSNNRTLIMKIHVNNNHTQGDQITYYAFVEKVYQGRSSGNVVQILYQSMKDPCYTNYFNDWYVVAIPYATMAAKPSVCADLPGAPECFFIQLNQCYYFKLYSELTKGELQVLAAHGN